MHKWALKQFMRIVAHGRHVGAHLSQRHCAQFVFSTPAEPPQPVKPRFCHCGEQPACTHTRHVHADMPGLAEEDDGSYTPIRLFTRSATKVYVSSTDEHFKHALRVFIADCNGEDSKDAYKVAVLPAKVYRTHSMQLNWHDNHGDLEVCMEGGGLHTGKYARHMPGIPESLLCDTGKYARHMPGISLPLRRCRRPSTHRMTSTAGVSGTML